jgi:hypothetical protein|tara:strand:- start:412 stop:687 length:276 start_codon:yes stop_codon:yes gene_type:complete
MIKLKDHVDVRLVSDEFKVLLEALEQSIDSLLKIEVGLNISTKASAQDIVLIADFDNVDGLNMYRVHPEHVVVLDYLKEVMEKAAVVDYII